ncbi:hypothetical protein D9M69_537310 [compost metagenome]
MAKHQQHAAVAHGHGECLQSRDATLVDHPAQHQHQRWIEVEDESLQAGADVLQAPEIQEAGEVIAGEAQAQDAHPVPAGERRLRSTPLPVGGPPGQRQKQRQRKQHAVHDQRDRVHTMAVGKLHDDGLAAEGNGACAREQQSGGEMRCGGGAHRSIIGNAR